MANINANATTTVVAGTTGDDAITLAAALGANNIDGNGGADTLTLNNAGDTLDALATVALAYASGTDTWTVGGASLTEGFTTVTTVDGAVLEAGVASEGTTNLPTAIAGGTGTANISSAFDYSWTGAAVTTTALTIGIAATEYSLVSVDGTAVGAANFSNADGQFNVTGSNVAFTPNTAAIAAQGNVGDTASFTYDVVVEHNTTGEQSTVSVTYSQEIDYTTGNDTFTGTDAVDTEDGLAGDDMISGGEGNDALTGNAGNDTLLGENGNDNLNGGTGNNVIRGGNGDDTIVVTGAAATDSNTLGGGAGADNITGGAGSDTLFGGNGDDSNLDGGLGNDVVNGGAGDDALVGNDGNDTLRGGDGDDNLQGGNGVDELRGGAGNDTYDGGAGADMMYVSLGDDIMDGGAGDDTFILRDDSGNTLINNFATGDKLNVEDLGYNDLADVLAVAYQTNAGVVIGIDADTTVTLDSLTLADLDASDFDFA
ncbi:calcium-binding protein [Phaeobacter inhibens]|uniref:calcium-binding protein n=1 Tax=Phaeobacter inhibens TaxID=221822 RepID=UPI000C9B9B47|nr:calcium-binding protein [Phaeobacter inhibens]AUQ64818.1 hemolysin-like protein [Phaeobacter inhibens]